MVIYWPVEIRDILYFAVTHTFLIIMILSFPDTRVLRLNHIFEGSHKAGGQIVHANNVNLLCEGHRGSRTMTCTRYLS